MRKYALLLMGLFILMHPAVHGSAFAAEEDQTFLLNESQIFGSGSLEAAPPWSDELRYVEFPALSTTLPWEGVEEKDLDIPKEILDHLSQSSPSDQDSQGLNRDHTRNDIPLN
ncbi:MAG: hypothetical protein ABGX83_03685 [Nitrospira sp.]|nr:hypothetical protein [Candidatus Manganitrophaceae bacterium]HIL34240.1 hypothetical protein [Candidatus Manganitrophaceae bacterium]